MITDVEKEHITRAIDREYVRSISKHGNWNNMDYRGMLRAIFGEYLEVAEAEDKNDHHGEHGTFKELSQVAACCKKMMVQVLRREKGATDGG